MIPAPPTQICVHQSGRGHFSNYPRSPLRSERITTGERGGSHRRETRLTPEGNRITQALQQFPEESLGRFGIAPTLHQDVEDVTLLVDGSPQVLDLATNADKHFIEVSLIAGRRSTVPQRPQTPARSAHPIR